MLITLTKIQETTQLNDSLLDVMLRLEDMAEKDSQIDKPYLKIWEKERVMAIVCNEELWQFVKQLESLDENNFTIAKMGKIYYELKKLLKKGFIHEGGKTIYE